jgi:conjugative transfer signal peptidase TraF
VGERQAVKLVFAAVASVALIIGLARIERIRIITTDSASPAGIYQTVALPYVARGTLVLACLPPRAVQLALSRSYIGAGNCPDGVEPIAKIVGAVPGDTLEIEAAAVTVNGVLIPHSETAKRDSMGRPLQHAAWGKRIVAAGEVWLFGFHNPRSWDARFFGSVPLANVLGGLVPLVTW